MPPVNKDVPIAIDFESPEWDNEGQEKQVITCTGAGWDTGRRKSRKCLRTCSVCLIHLTLQWKCTGCSGGHAAANSVEGR